MKGSALLAIVTISLIGQAVRTSGQSQLSLGTFSLGPTTTEGCPSGFTCNTFTVICPGIARNETGVIAYQQPSGQITGMVMFFSGSEGVTWWSGTGTGVPAFFQSLLNDGLELVQVQWTHGWALAPNGVQCGQELLASRPATVIKWVHDNLYAPLGLPQPNGGVCGFCLTGNSDGASAITYPEASYGLDNIIDAAVPTSGPTWAAIAKGCLQQQGYAYIPGDQ